MRELLDKVYETPNTFDVAIIVQTPDFEETYISDNLRRSYQPARAEGLIFRLIASFVQRLDLDYQEFIDVLKGDLEDELFNVKAMRKIKRPRHDLPEEKLSKAEQRVGEIVDFAEDLVKEGAIGDYVLVANYTNKLGEVYFQDSSDQNMSTYHDIQAKLLNKEAFEDRAINGFKVEDFWQVYRVPYQGGQFEIQTPEGDRLEQEIIGFSKKLQQLDLTYYILFIRTERYIYVLTPSFKTEDDLVKALPGYLTGLEANMDFTDEKFKEISDMMLEEKSYLSLVHGGDSAYAIDLPVKKEITDEQEIRLDIHDIYSELLTYQKMGLVRDFYLFSNMKDNTFIGGKMESEDLTNYLLNFVELLGYLTHMYPNLSPQKIIDLVAIKDKLKRKRK